MPFVGHEDVRRLDVSVDQAAAVHGRDAVDQLNRQIQHAIGTQCAGCKHGVEPASFEQLADQERLAVLLARIVNGADVRVS